MKAAREPSDFAKDTLTMAVMDNVISLSTVTAQLGFSVVPGTVGSSGSLFLSLQPVRVQNTAHRIQTDNALSKLQFLTCDIIFLIVSNYYYMVIFDDLVDTGLVRRTEDNRSFEATGMGVRGVHQW